MAKSNWKELERQWATALGGRRVPVTGRSRGDVPDIEHPLWAIELKTGKALVSSRIKTALDQAAAAAAGTDKTPLVCIEETRKGGNDEQRRRGSLKLVVMTLDDFLAWNGPVENQHER